MVYCNTRRSRRVMTTLPISLNSLLIFLGIFILFAMSIVLIIFEEFTAFTDYTQQWIEFNFFIYYWDKLTITRVYLSFIFIYGAVIIACASLQIYGLRKKDLNFLHLAPLILIGIAVITVLGAICWLIVTAVNYNEGFLATGGFIFERMRFKGNVWKDLVYREESFRVVTENRVPEKAQIIKIWVHQVYGCANNFQTINRESVVNTRGCRHVMYSWYRSGFAENIVMSIIGILIGAYEFYLYSVNRKEYFKLLDELDDMRKPMMNTTMSMSTIHSKNGSCAGGNVQGIGCSSNLGQGHSINFGPKPVYQPRLSEEPHTPSITGSQSGLLPSNRAQYSNPLQNVQNMSGRFNAPKRFQSNQNTGNNGEFENQPQYEGSFNDNGPQYEGVMFNNDAAYDEYEQ